MTSPSKRSTCAYAACFKVCCTICWCNSRFSHAVRQWTDDDATCQQTGQHIFLPSSPDETAETLGQLQCDVATRVGVHPESSWLLQLHPDRSLVVKHRPIETSAECSCPVGDGPFTTWSCRTSTSRATLASYSFPHYVEGRSVMFLVHMNQCPAYISEEVSFHPSQRRLRSSDGTN